MRTLRTGVPGLLTLLLAACGGGGQQVGGYAEAADSADQLMINLTTYLTNQGVRQAFLEADTGFVYETRGRTELRKVRITFYTQNGVRTSTLTSDSGTYNMRTGAMEAQGNVVVVRADGARLSTSLLRYDQARNEVSTDRAYNFVAPDRNIRGDGFVSDPGFTNIVTQRPRGQAGQFALPGQ
jgi:LPS export ABC transporter protein LptC